MSVRQEQVWLFKVWFTTMFPERSAAVIVMVPEAVLHALVAV